MLAKLKGWRTVIWNLFLALVPVLIVGLDRLGTIDLTKYMNEVDAIVVGVVIGGIGVWLRYLTTTPIGEP